MSQRHREDLRLMSSRSNAGLFGKEGELSVGLKGTSLIFPLLIVLWKLVRSRSG